MAMLTSCLAYKNNVISAALYCTGNQAAGLCAHVCVLHKPQQQHYGQFQAASPARVNAASADSALP